MALSMLKKTLGYGAQPKIEVYSALSTDELENMTPIQLSNGKYKDVAKDTGRDLMVRYLKTRDSVHGVYFGGTSSHSSFHHIDSKVLDYPKFAAGYASQALSRHSAHGFGNSVNTDNVNGFMNTVYHSKGFNTAANDFYQQAYYDNVRGFNNNTFRKYVDDNATYWGKQLSDRITSHPWINSKMNLIISQGWPEHTKQLDALLYMVDQLNPSLTDKTYKTLSEVKLFEGMKSDPKARDWTSFDTSLIQGNVSNAANSSYSYTWTVNDPDPKVPNQTYQTTIWGEGVANWLNSTARNYGFFVSGKLKNKDTVQIGGGCNIL